MNKSHLFSLFCLILGIVFLFFGFLSGDVEAGIFIVFPFVSGIGIYAFIGFVFILAAVFLFFVGLTDFFDLNRDKIEDLELKPRDKTSFKRGGVVLIGPIPIVFASNWKIAVILIIISIIFLFVAFFSFRF